MEKTVRLSTVRSTLGLLTTVHQLPTNYQVQYIKIKAESPLDLTIKPFGEHHPSAMTPPSTPSPLKKRYREVENEQFTKILSPLKKRYREDEAFQPQKVLLTPQQIKQETTPKKSATKPASVNLKSAKNPPKEPKERKSKAVKKLKFDEFRSSPVSGTIIRLLDEIDEHDIQESGDIDPQYNIVEVTDEAKAELATIPNVIGAYQCKLCRNEYDDAFGLARHRCNCIVLLEYRCPECGKKFNCPANLGKRNHPTTTSALSWHSKSFFCVQPQNSFASSLAQTARPSQQKARRGGGERADVPLQGMRKNIQAPGVSEKASGDPQQKASERQRTRQEIIVIAERIVGEFIRRSLEPLARQRRHSHTTACVQLQSGALAGPILGQ